MLWVYNNKNNYHLIITQSKKKPAHRVEGTSSKSKQGKTDSTIISLFFLAFCNYQQLHALLLCQCLASQLIFFDEIWSEIKKRKKIFSTFNLLLFLQEVLATVVVWKREGCCLYLSGMYLSKNCLPIERAVFDTLRLRQQRR